MNVKKKKILDLKHTENQEKAKSARKEISLFISHECKKKKFLIWSTQKNQEKAKSERKEISLYIL